MDGRNILHKHLNQTPMSVPDSLYMRIHPVHKDAGIWAIIGCCMMHMLLGHGQGSLHT